MANTQRNDDSTETVVDTSAADNAAWIEAAKARKYRVHENTVFTYAAGMLLPALAPQGFAGLHPGLRPGACQALIQYAQNRIGQTTDGDVAAKLGAWFTDGSNTPNAQSNDGFDSAYRDHIADLVHAKLGDHTKDKFGEPLTGEELKLAKAKRDGVIDSSAAMETNKAKYWQVALENALTAGKNKPVSGKAKRTPAASPDAVEL